MLGECQFVGLCMGEFGRIWGYGRDVIALSGIFASEICEYAWLFAH